MLAREFGTTSGDVSYHLRQLERYGFISEDVEHGNRRDRWWRANHRFTQFDLATLPPEEREIGHQFNAQLVQETLSRLTSAARAVPDWPAEWQERFGISDIQLALTADETKELQARLFAVLEEYRPHQPEQPMAEGRRKVTVQIQTFLDDAGEP